mmetsp:Transcript_36506/g.50702  ORF Transcript_36506/g.50702 Transcript_36506/m.50702 type:complete len:206 (-) Transcript_36506:439-1056(-)
MYTFSSLVTTSCLILPPSSLLSPWMSVSFTPSTHSCTSTWREEYSSSTSGTFTMPRTEGTASSSVRNLAPLAASCKKSSSSINLAALASSTANKAAAFWRQERAKSEPPGKPMKNSITERIVSRSRVTVERIPGRWILTATVMPEDFRVALYTWPMDAAATGSSKAARSWKMSPSGRPSSASKEARASTELKGDTCSSSFCISSR